jgi:hypothetical protein
VGDSALAAQLAAQWTEAISQAAASHGHRASGEQPRRKQIDLGCTEAPLLTAASWDRHDGILTQIAYRIVRIGQIFPARKHHCEAQISTSVARRSAPLAAAP